MIAEGKAVPRAHDRRPKPLNELLDTPEVADDFEIEKVLLAAEKDLGPALTTDDLIQRLSAIVRVAGTSQLGVTAILALNRIRESLGARDKLGPGAPLTSDDRIFRAALILEACSFDEAVSAFKKAHPGKDLDGKEVQTA